MLVCHLNHTMLDITDLLYDSRICFDYFSSFMNILIASCYQRRQTNDANQWLGQLRKKRDRSRQTDNQTRIFKCLNQLNRLVLTFSYLKQQTIAEPANCNGNRMTCYI